MITVVSLSPALDVTYEVAELVEGTTHRPTGVHRHPGGKGANLARAAATMGAEVRLVTLLPTGTRGWFAAELAADSVPVHAANTVSPLRSCVSVASEASSLMTEVYEHPVGVTEGEAQALLELVLSLHDPESDWLVVAGGVAPGAGTRLVGELLQRVGLGAAVAVDTHGPPLEVAVEHRPRLIKVNRSEAAALAGTDRPGTEVVELVAAAQQRTGGVVVVTDSVRGALASDGATLWNLGPPVATGAYPQGSGDAFLGGLLAACSRGAGLPDALREGAGCATANALVPGGGRFDPQAARVFARDADLVHEPVTQVPSSRTGLP